MKCWFCGEELIWQNDFDYEDYGLGGEGIVTILYCPNCESMWEGYLNLKEKNEKVTNQ